MRAVRPGRYPQVPPELVEVEGEVEERRQLAPPLGRRERRRLEVGSFHFLVGQPLPARVLRKSLKRGVGAVVPQPLQIGVAPRGMGNGVRLTRGRCLAAGFPPTRNTRTASASTALPAEELPILAGPFTPLIHCTGAQPPQVRTVPEDRDVGVGLEILRLQPRPAGLRVTRGARSWARRLRHVWRERRSRRWSPSTLAVRHRQSLRGRSGRRRHIRREVRAAGSL